MQRIAIHNKVLRLSVVDAIKFIFINKLAPRCQALGRIGDGPEVERVLARR